MKINKYCRSEGVQESAFSLLDGMVSLKGPSNGAHLRHDLDALAIAGRVSPLVADLALGALVGRTASLSDHESNEEDTEGVDDLDRVHGGSVLGGCLVGLEKVGCFVLWRRAVAWC